MYFLSTSVSLALFYPLLTSLTTHSYTQKNTPERIAPFLRDWFTKLQYSVPSCEKIEYHMRPYVRSKKETWKVESNVVVEVVNALTKNHSIVPDSRIYLLLLAAYDRLNNLPAVPSLPPLPPLTFPLPSSTYSRITIDCWAAHGDGVERLP